MSAERADSAPAPAVRSDGRQRILAVSLLVVAAMTLLLAVYVAGRAAPRQSGDLVQLWIVPGAAEVGLRNGLGVALRCVLDPGLAATPRELELAPGETVFVELDAGASGVDVVAECTDGTTPFSRRVALDGGTAP